MKAKKDTSEKTEKIGESASSAERVRKFRARKQKLDEQIVIGVAKLILGRGAGEQRGALLQLMEKAIDADGLDDDEFDLVSQAIQQLKLRGARF